MKVKRAAFFIIVVISLFSALLFVPTICSRFIVFLEKSLGEPLNHEKWMVRLPVYMSVLSISCLSSYFYVVNSIKKLSQNTKSRFFLYLNAVFFGVFLIFVQPSFVVSLAKHFSGLEREDFWLMSIVFWLFFVCSAALFAYGKRAFLSESIFAELCPPPLIHELKRWFLPFSFFLLFCYFPVLFAQSGQGAVDTERLFLCGLTDGFHAQSRFLSEILLKVFHMSKSIYNTTPLMQMIGIAELSLVGIVLSLVCAKKVTKMTLLVSLFAVLSPWFTNNMAYVHDACLHPLSILFGIFPFLFLGHRAAFVAVSIVCNYLMCMTYQLSSGIYVIVALHVALNSYLAKEKTLARTFSFLAIAAASYFIPLAFYEFGVFYAHPWNDYATGSLPPLSMIPAVVAANVGMYLGFVTSDLGMTPLFIVCVVFSVGGIVSRIACSKRNKFVSAIFVLLVFCLSLILSFGISLALEKPLWNPRAFIGIGVFLALQAFNFFDAFEEKKAFFRYSGLCVLAIGSYCLVLFSFAYGAAMYQQRLYVDSRMDALAADLSEMNMDFRTAEIETLGTFGFAPAVSFAARTYPLLSRSVHLRSEWLGTVFLLLRRGIGVPSKYVPRYQFDNLDLKILKDTSFYTIYGDGTHFRIVLKS